MNRANVCVLLLAAVLCGGCATLFPDPKPERECERIETVWDAELEQTKIVEYGCVQLEKADRKVLMTVLQIVGAIVGICVLLL